MDWGELRLKLRFTLYTAVSLRLCGVLSTPNLDPCNRRCICFALETDGWGADRPPLRGKIRTRPSHAVRFLFRGGPLAHRLKEQRSGGGRNVQRRRSVRPGEWQ